MVYYLNYVVIRNNSMKTVVIDMKYLYSKFNLYSNDEYLFFI